MMEFKTMVREYKATLKREGIREQEFLEGIMIPQAIKGYLSLTRNGQWTRRLEIKKYIDWMHDKIILQAGFDIEKVWEDMRKQLEYESMKSTELLAKGSIQVQEKILKETKINQDWLQRIARWNRHALDDKKSQWLELGEYHHVRTIDIASTEMRKEGDKMLGTVVLWDGEKIDTNIEIRDLYKMIGI